MSRHRDPESGTSWLEVVLLVVCLIAVWAALIFFVVAARDTGFFEFGW